MTQAMIPGNGNGNGSDPRLVSDINPLWGGHSLQAASMGEPIEFAVQRSGRFEIAAYPAPDPQGLRGTVEAGGRQSPSQEWADAERIDLYDAAALPLAKHAKCRTVKRSGSRSAKRSVAAQPVTSVAARSGPVTATLAAGVYVVVSSARLPIALHIHALPPLPERRPGSPERRQ
jgi:hypothetical protein